jgi:hypothetical protein
MTQINTNFTHLKNSFTFKSNLVTKVGKLLLLAFTLHLSAYSQPKLTIQWDKQVIVSKSIPTLQVVVNPPLRRGATIHDASFSALKNLGADYVRYVPWLPFPRLGVAELEPPTDKKTSWDFTLIDPLTIDFLEATKGHPAILNFSTIPQWMFVTEKPVTYPVNPDEVIWNYSQGTQLVDTTGKQVADYFVRLFSWYTKGGFTDELGKKHVSGYHYSIPYWEILNEPEFEHQPTPQQYTKLYDAVVGAMKKEFPETKFVGMALAFEKTPEWFEYFLDPKNHLPGIPIDMISYHFYAILPYQSVDVMQYTYFTTADGFIDRVRYVDHIRKRLSPHTRTALNELGSIIPDEKQPIPPEYWSLSGSLFAYLYVNLAKLGIDVIAESQLVGYPTQYPSVSMMNWITGEPNARYWTLKLLIDNFGPGDVLVDTKIENDTDEAITSQGFKTKEGNKILVINKRNRIVTLHLPDQCKGKKIRVTDISTGDKTPAISTIDATSIELKPFAVAVIAD